MIQKLIQLDVNLSNRFRMQVDQSFRWKLVAFLAHSGDSWFWLFGLGIIWLFSKAWKSFSAFLIVDIVLLAALVMSIKFLVRRSRPPGEWGSIYRNTDPHSFPSGHAARAVMIASVVAANAPLWVTVCVIIWAVLVSLSRIFTGMHYVSDVLAGMVLGLLSAGVFLSAQEWMQTTLPFLFG